VDLSKRRIKINSTYQITLGRILMVGFITLFQILGIMCMNSWALVPEVFFLMSNAVLTLGKYEEEIKDD